MSITGGDTWHTRGLLIKCIRELLYGLAVGYRTDTYALVTYWRVGIILAPPPIYATSSVYVRVLTHSTGKPHKFMQGHTC
jgi:hypothetical protein